MAPRTTRDGSLQYAREFAVVGNAVVDDVVVDVAAIGAAAKFDIHHVPAPRVANYRKCKSLPDRRYSREPAPVCERYAQRALRGRR